jgi:hypothetical protein
MPLVLRSVKGSRLTIVEMDGNWTFLQGRIQSLEDDPPVARGIESIDQIGNSLIINYDDSTQDGPFPLGDIQLTFRDEWTISTNYLKYEIVTFNGSVYMINVAHTSSPTEFDPEATNGDVNLYNLLLEFPGHVIPTGGLTDAVLTKLSDDNFNMGWRARGVPPDGDAGDVLEKLSGDEGDYAWVPRGSLTKSVIQVTDLEITLDTLNYANTFLNCTNVAGCEIGIYDFATVPMPIGAEVEVRQGNVGFVSFVAVPASGVTIQPILGFDPVSAEQGSVIIAKHISLDFWAVWGFLGVFSTDSD